MATQAQYDFFKDLYEEENARAQSLIDRGKIYLSIVSLFFGGVFLKLDWAIDHRNEIERGFGFYVIGTASFLIALVLVCLALQVLSYEALTDPEELIVQISGEQAADAEFRAARIADYKLRLCETPIKMTGGRSIYRYRWRLSSLGQCCFALEWR